jgi:FtsP/CotA-like multicopper oxidase with cupredoxin domain
VGERRGGVRRRSIIAGLGGLTLAAGGAAALVGGGVAAQGDPPQPAAVAASGASHGLHAASTSAGPRLAALKLDFQPGQPLVDPPVIRPKRGVTSIDLTAKTVRTEIGGAQAISNVFNGLLPAPTVEVSPGQRLDIKLLNENPDAEPTNLHTHGLHVSPRSPGDNVFLNLPTGSSYQYVHKIPRDHIPGLYWYHPHRHRFTDTQVFAGQSGAIIVRGGLDDLPAIKDLRERVMVFQSFQLDDKGRVLRQPSSSQPAKQLQLINGQLRPRIDMRPGETQRWRILNTSADKFLVLRLRGHNMWLLADDGNPRATPERVSKQFIGPGERREVLVQATKPGRYDLQSLYFVPVRAQPSYSSPTRDIGTLVVSGEPMEPQPIPERLLPVEDLRTQRVDRRREIVYGEGFDAATETPSFTINGREFDPDFVAETMKLNTVEEWTIRNTTDEWHTFHIHVNPFQVTKLNGKRVKGVRWNDDITVGPYGGTVTMRTRFTDFTGKFVIHCHVLFHEDNGMMAAVQVVR